MIDLAYWQNIWKSFPISPWSVALYLVLSRWASKKLPSTSYKRIAWLASWADTICILGIVVLIGDIIWVLVCWIRWNSLFPQNPMLLALNIARNIAIIIICRLLMSRNWLREGYINLNREVIYLVGLNISFIILHFYFAPGKEWTHWLYALKNDYACWPYVWFINYPIGRTITSYLWIKMWSIQHVN